MDMTFDWFEIAKNCFRPHNVILLDLYVLKMTVVQSEIRVFRGFYHNIARFIVGWILIYLGYFALIGTKDRMLLIYSYSIFAPINAGMNAIGI